MNNSAVNLLKSYLKDLPASSTNAIVSKLGTVKSAEDVAAIFTEYEIGFDKEACDNIFNALSGEKRKALSDEDLELVTGGCDDSGC